MKDTWLVTALSLAPVVQGLAGEVVETPLAAALLENAIVVEDRAT